MQYILMSIGKRDPTLIAYRGFAILWDLKWEDLELTVSPYILYKPPSEG